MLKMKLILAMLCLTCTVSATSDTVMDVLETLENVKMFVAFLKQVRQDSALENKGPYTVFAATDTAVAAFVQDLPADVLNKTGSSILRFHQVNGAMMSGDLKNNQIIPSLAGPLIRINVYTEHIPAVITATGAPVMKPDNVASNGVVHVIDKVMYPFPFLTIMEVATTTADLITASMAFYHAGLIGTLSGPGPFTVFAPTDEAFAKLSPIIDALLKNVTALTTFMKYNVVSDVYYVAGLYNGEVLTTMEGQNITINLPKDGRPMVNDANIIETLPGRNGALHIIDAVLIPPPRQTELAGTKKNT